MPAEQPPDLPGRAFKPGLVYREEAGHRFPMLVWRFARPVRAISCGPFGGGLGERHWLLHATVHRDYDRCDPEVHIAELAADLDLTGPGAGLLTAVDVTDAVEAVDGEVVVVATVGLGHPTRAAAPAGPDSAGTVGTINVVAFLPVPFSDAALVNAVATATEAKVQALADAGVDATGTATDALFLAAPTTVAGIGQPPQPYGGPRSIWGSRLARAVYTAVEQGSRAWLRRGDR
jgi:adenosylcobinamide amidohydrolase